MKILVKNSLLLIVCQSGLVFGQGNPIGKSYTALMGTACKERTDGGCTLKEYCTLTFEKDTVTISYAAKASCSPKNLEAYYEEEAQKNKFRLAWSEQNSIITIKNFNDFGNLYLSDTILMGSKEVNGKREELKFTATEP